MERATLVSVCSAWHACIRHMSGEVRDLICEPPSTEDEVLQVERDLGYSLPPAMRRVLLEISSCFEFRWYLPQNLRLPDPFRSNFSGDLGWSLKLLSELQAAKDDWVKQVFPDPENPYDRVWHQTMAFQHVPNGDYLAISLRPGSYEKVVYLSHDDGKGHGCSLAGDFMALLDSWVPLGCPGAEDWQWLPFAEDREGGINPHGSVAQKWLDLFHMRNPEGPGRVA